MLNSHLLLPQLKIGVSRHENDILLQAYCIAINIRNRERIRGFLANSSLEFLCFGIIYGKQRFKKGPKSRSSWEG